MKFLSSKRSRLLAALIVILALFLLRPGASRLKSRVIHSISAEFGRSADVGSVHIRLLPRPGFDLQNLVVYDDPSFGAEPILRANEVTAYLRVTSLARGKLEIARLELTEPSLNLAHSEDGRWNLEALLERTRTPIASAEKPKSQPRPRFPYIEGTAGRINFKTGAEKTPYALTNADFSLWQESDNEWGVRLRAQPFRSDFNLNDTGLLTVSGTWQRADTLRESPLQFNIEWSRAQLGQLTKFVSGADQGWRGAIQLDAAFTGTPLKLRVTGDVAVDDFRRYDITSGKALRLAAHCDAEYSSLDHDFHEVMCSAPTGKGSVTLTGNVGLPRSHRYSVLLTAENVPAGGLIVLAQRAKKNLPDDLEAGGSLNGRFSMQADPQSGSPPEFKGTGEISEFELTSTAATAAVGPLTVPFVLNSGLPAPRSVKKKAAGFESAFSGPYLELGPVIVSSSRAGNTILRGSIGRSSYRFALDGETEIGKSLKLARLVGLPVLATTAEGAAHANLQITGDWAGQQDAAGGFSPPQINGSARLHHVVIAVHGLGSPIELLSADLALSPDGVRVSKLIAKAANADWTGSLDMRRGCGTVNACPIHFTLSTSQTSLADLNEWLHPNSKAKPWYRMLGGGTTTAAPLFASLHVTGRLTADRFQISNVASSHASVNLSIENGKAKFSDLNADLLGGKHQGQWLVDFSEKPAVCEGAGSLAGVSFTGLSDTMNRRWISGTGNASYKVKTNCATGFWPFATATLEFEMRDGALPRGVAGDSSELLRFDRLNGVAELKAGTIEIKDTELDSADGQYELSGTASLQRDIDLQLTRAGNRSTAAGYSLTGTLADPKITPLAADEQARLKTVPTK